MSNLFCSGKSAQKKGNPSEVKIINNQAPLVNWSDSEPEDVLNQSEDNRHHRRRAVSDKQDGADHHDHQVQSNSVPDLQRSI